MIREIAQEIARDVSQDTSREIAQDIAPTKVAATRVAPRPRCAAVAAAISRRAWRHGRGAPGEG
eukprot:scaffold92135_cov33-Phaeocystis_antarctica.AAC.1